MGQQVMGQNMGCCAADNSACVRNGCTISESADRMAQIHEIEDTRFDMAGARSRFQRMKVEVGPTGQAEIVKSTSSMASLSSLSYNPVKFDVASTTDIQRSEARYANALDVSVSPYKPPGGTKLNLCDDWLRSATASGRNVTLIVGAAEETPSVSDSNSPSNSTAPTELCCKRIPARYFVDRALTRITFLPVEEVSADNSRPFAAIAGETVIFDNIQVICTGDDFTLFADEVESQLDASERCRAVLLQYMQEQPKCDNERICFLEASEEDKDYFVKSVTALWMENRADKGL